MKVTNNVRTWSGTVSKRWAYVVTESVINPGHTTTIVLASSHPDYRTRLGAWIAGERHLVRIKKEQAS